MPKEKAQRDSACLKQINVEEAPVVMLVGIVFLAVIYPAGKAALIQPASAMRYN